MTLSSVAKVSVEFLFMSLYAWRNVRLAAGGTETKYRLLFAQAPKPLSRFDFEIGIGRLGIGNAWVMWCLVIAAIAFRIGLDLGPYTELIDTVFQFSAFHWSILTLLPALYN